MRAASRRGTHGPRIGVMLLAPVLVLIVGGRLDRIAGAVASNDERITVLPARTLAPRGGVMAIALDPRAPDEGWPRTVPVRLEDGRTLEGRVAAAVAAPSGGVGWTTPAVPRRVVAAADLEPDRAMLGLPRLLVVLPRDADGPIEVAGTTLRPVWADPAAGYTRFDLPGPEAPELAIDDVEPDARPDAEDPFEHWRWVLLADREGRRPPDPGRFRGQSREAELLARSEADRWRIGLARIGAASPGIAAACRDLLVARVADPVGTGLLAAWEADPARLATLLQVLLDFPRDAAASADAALAWADARPDWVAWPHATGRDDGLEVGLTVLHRGRGDLPVVLRWQHPPDRRSESSPPGPAALRDVVGPLRGRSFRAARPDATRPGPEPPPLRPGFAEAVPSVAVAAPVLEIELGADRLAIAASPRWAEAGPPAAALPAFRPVLRLAEVVRGGQSPIDPAFATAAQLRRRDGRWELFVECRRPPEVLTEGRDELEIRIGTDSTPKIHLIVPENGPVIRELGPPADPGVHRRSWGDRWYLRLVLPERWIAEARLGVGIVRRTTPAAAASPLVQSSPAALAPGGRPSDDPGRHLVDLATW